MMKQLISVFLFFIFLQTNGQVLPTNADALDSLTNYYNQHWLVDGAKAYRTGLPQCFEAKQEALQKLSADLHLKWKADSTQAVKMGLPLFVSTEKLKLSFSGFEGNSPAYCIPATLDEVVYIDVDDLRNYTSPPLEGDGLVIGMWEVFFGTNQAYPDVTNPNLQMAGLPRITLKDAGTVVVSGHATDVALTLAGDGSANPNSGQGVAPKALIDSWNETGVLSELAGQAASLLVSNHSYTDARGWLNIPIPWTLGAVTKNVTWWSESNVSTTADYGFGSYFQSDKILDQIAAAAPYHCIVKGAGNDRGEQYTSPVITFYTSDGINYSFDETPSPLADGGITGFDCIPSGSTAKNIFTIGAYNIATNSIGASSSFGPTDDGRIKPDFVAPGSVTSYSTPNMSGSILLVQELAYRENGNYLRAATIKALFAQTALDIETAGPDYKSGWGLIQPKKVADIILDNGGGSQILESTLADSEANYHYFYTDGTSPLVATLCWTDPEGTPITRTYTATDLNNTSPMLVNDLDLRVINLSGSTTWQPYVLDPINPANAATAGDNFRDNIEKIQQNSPPAGWYVVQINHKNTLASPQEYSLVVSGVKNMGCAANAPVTINNVWDGSNWSIPFVDGQNVLIEDNLTLTSTTKFGSVFLNEGVSISGSQSLEISGDAYFSLNEIKPAATIVKGLGNQVFCGNVEFGYLTVDKSSSLTLSNGTAGITGILSLENGILNTNSNLILRATGANYSEILENNGSINGMVTYKINVAGQSGWRHIASPVNTTIEDVLEETNNYNLAAVGGSVYSWNAPTGQWKAPNGLADAFDATTPHIVFFGQNGSINFSHLPHTIEVKGIPNSGLVDNTVYFGSATAATNNEQGWNLLANPYPQALDWNTIKPNLGAQINQTYFVWDANNGNFQSHDGTVGSSSLNGFIAPMQAFFVRLLDASAANTTAFDFTNANRGIGTPQFLKNVPPYITLRATQNNRFDEMYVAFEENATLGFDSLFDGLKLFSSQGETPQLNSLAGQTNLAINYLPTNKAYYNIPLAYKNAEQGLLVFSIDSATVPENWKIEIEDTQTGNKFDLRLGALQFNHKPTNEVNRFVLHIFSDKKSTLSNQLQAWQTEDALVVKMAHPVSIAKLSVIDMTGRVLFENRYSDLQETKLPKMKSSGLYIIHVVDNEGNNYTIKIPTL